MPPPSSPVLSSQPPPPPLPRRRFLHQPQPPSEEILDLDQHHYNSISLENALLHGSSLQAAQAQAAELRALHAAMVASNPQHHYKYYQKQQPHHQHFRPLNKACEQWRSIKSPAGDHVFPLSSPASVTDSFTAASTHEYPIFTPTSEELMFGGSTSTFEIESTRNSMDARDIIQAERLNYILDNSKRSMSTLGRSANYTTYKVGAMKGQLGEQANAKKPLFELITEEAARKKGSLYEIGITGGQSNGDQGCTKRKPASAGNDHHVDEGLSCDKCRPTASTAAKTVVPLADSREFSDTRSAKGTPQTASKIKGGAGIPGGHTNPIKAWWFSRVKPKKHGSLPTDTHVEAAARTTFSSSREQSVSSSLHAEVEKDLELAMAMDLMELKVQQATIRRDMAIGEVVEMRVAMEAMGRRVAELEGCCRGLRAELGEARARKEEEEEGGGGEGEEEEEDEAVAGADDVYNDDDVGVSSRSHGYTGSAREVPSRSEFFHAVTEARVEVRQLCRALLQHLQEADMAAEAGEEMKKKIKEKEKKKPAEEEEEEEEEEEQEEEEEEQEASGALRALLARSRGHRSSSLALRSHLESLVNLILFHHFENIAFQRGGAHPASLLHPSARARTSYRTYLAAARVPPSTLLAHNPSFHHFCQRKLASLSCALGLHQSPRATWRAELLETFYVAARSVWLVHQLCLSFVPPSHASILRVARDTAFDIRFMEELPCEVGYLSHKHQLTTSQQHLLVKLMVMPGFYVNNHVIKCKVLCWHM